ncbi:EAL domain-containing protein [Phytohalomonas tamaricis]|uniref:EAL domain-containing protein n=1 Tax=Phytohalomonas tamaricis TaxID=2081032 RepID=UPI000D0ACC1E|nr:EAL domain-containing protein [Phytohalomonas tamaricis]
MIHFISDSTAAEAAISGSYDYSLVLLSYLVALLAAYAGLLIAEQLRDAPTRSRRLTWLWAGAIMFGIGVWSMHFVGMLAYQLPVKMSYDVGLTLLSGVPAILCSAYTLTIIARPTPTHKTSLLGGVVLGVGIGLMHYLGMAAMRMPATLSYYSPLFLLSLVTAVSLGITALYAHRLRINLPAWLGIDLRHLVVAAIIALAISGMHYTAMFAAHYIPSEATEHHQHHVSWLAWSVLGGTIFVVAATLTVIFIDRRLQHNEQLANMSRDRLLEIITAINDGLLLLDEEGRILMCNRAFTHITGYEEDEVLGHPIAMLEHGSSVRSITEYVQENLRDRGKWQGEIDAQRKGGERFPARLSVSFVDYRRSPLRHCVATLSDISTQRDSEEKIRHLAYYDALTGLPNRRLLYDRLHATREECAQTNSHGALVLIDIDKFKLLNDTFGHAKGDMLLCNIAQKLCAFSKEEINIARLGGNEFALAITQLPQNEREAIAAVIAAIKAIQHSINTDYRLADVHHVTTSSFGTALFHGGQNTVDNLVKQASLALSHAKQAGGNTVRFFEPSMEHDLNERVQLETDLRQALNEGDQLRLYYQSQVDSSGKIIGAESLVRWQHPERGMVSPGVFIPLAEESGLILPLGDWVLDSACAQLAAWARIPAMASLRLSVNVSVRQFQQPDFVFRTLAVMRRHGTPGERLTLELTESLLMTDLDDAISKMEQLNTHGVSFALDDFGTGYSSLTYLKCLPFSTLKLDVAFVRDILVDANDAAIVRTIIALAASLKFKVVAEGVESYEQFALLEQLGCRVHQGYYFGRPEPVDALESRLAMAS